jgi:GTPase SAR1 family protein
MPLYYRDAEIALLVFDLTDTDSFKEIDYWLSDLEEKVTKEGMLICIIGNKRDLIEKRRVSREEGELKASERANGFYHETSALTG